MALLGIGRQIAERRTVRPHRVDVLQVPLPHPLVLQGKGVVEAGRAVRHVPHQTGADGVIRPRHAEDVHDRRQQVHLAADVVDDHGTLESAGGQDQQRDPDILFVGRIDQGESCVVLTLRTTVVAQHKDDGSPVEPRRAQPLHQEPQAVIGVMEGLQEAAVLLVRAAVEAGRGIVGRHFPRVVMGDRKERQEGGPMLPVLLQQPVGRVLHQVLVVVSPACPLCLGEGPGNVLVSPHLGVAVIGKEFVLPLEPQRRAVK